MEKLDRALRASYDLASSDIIYPIFDSEEGGHILVAVFVPKVGLKVGFSGPPTPEIVKK